MTSNAGSAPRAKFTSPFAPLQLSPAETETLEQLSLVILHNYVAQYEEFERESGGVVDDAAWKPVKQREGVRIFAQRKRYRDGGVARLKRAVANNAASGLVQLSDLPVMLAVGSTVGTLDDVMYGVMNPTVDLMRVKSAYIDGHVGDAAVLKTLLEPTTDDPFQSLVLKWVQNETGRYLRPAVSCRDFVYMERSGLAYTSSGERVGFHLLHSVHFPQTHSVAPFVRGNVSVCGLYRQQPHSNQVEIYMRGILDARGSMIRPVIVMAAADMFTSVWKFVECAHLKKIMWLLRRKRREDAGAAVVTASDRRSKPTSESSHASSTKSTTLDSGIGSCVMCKRTLSATVVMSLLGGDARRRKCALCGMPVCSSCTIKRTLYQVSSGTSGKLWRRKFAFCGACYSEASRSNALEAARQELAASTSGNPNEGLSVWSDCFSPTSSD